MYMLNSSTYQCIVSLRMLNAYDAVLQRDDNCRAFSIFLALICYNIFYTPNICLMFFYSTFYLFCFYARNFDYDRINIFIIYYYLLYLLYLFDINYFLIAYDNFYYIFRILLCFIIIITY